MRIVVACSGICLGKGGAERAALRLAHELLARGHNIHLFTTMGDFAPVYAINPAISTHFFPAKFHLADGDAVLSGEKILADAKIDLMVSFEWSWRHALWQACAEEAGIPFVYSERITPFVVENKFWSADGRRNLLRYCAGIHELLPCYLEYIPKDCLSKTFVIPNAAPENTPDTFPAHATIQPVILYLGRFSKEKRPTLLLEAFALLTREFPNWKLYFAGWGEEQPALENMRRLLRLEDNVGIRAAAPDVVEEYRAANIYCLPTLHEGFSNTVLEAMAQGLPVVGIADCPAMTAVVKHGETGLLAKTSKAEDLAAALRPLMASEKARLRMGKNGWEECRRAYNPDLVFSAWEKRLETIVSDWEKK